MEPQRQKSRSACSSRRSLLATLSGGVVVGLAGCSGGGGEDTPTPTPPGPATETENEEEKLDIPGEVVHNGTDAVEVVSHGAYPVGGSYMNMRVTVRNAGDQTVEPEPTVPGENPLYVRVRTLSSGGNTVEIGRVQGGPSEIRPGTEATLKSNTRGDGVAEYELCLLSTDPGPIAGNDEWNELCSG